MLDLIFNRLKKNTLEYRIITRFGIIGGEGGGGLETFSKINHREGWNNGGSKNMR